MQDDLNPVAIITREGDGFAIPTSDGITTDGIGGGSSDIGNGSGSGCEKIPRV